MRLIIQDDKNAVGEWVATYIKKRIVDFNPTPDRPFVLGTRLEWHLYKSQAVNLKLFSCPVSNKIFSICFALGLPTGSSPLATYNKLVEFYKKGELSFKVFKS